MNVWMLTLDDGSQFPAVHLFATEQAAEEARERLTEEYRAWRSFLEVVEVQS